ncbi:ATP-binding protein [Streptomyces sp. NPDC057302]|uniref:ATP-binding protein n=1 Tax=Streptomyces sp. NPDC057302 TaxID=3346094 RepID=UPI003635F625
MGTRATPGILDVACHDVREAVRDVIEQACLDMPPNQARSFRDDALLVASELVSNAILHADGVTRFDAYIEDGFLVMRVGDRSTRAPHLVRPEPGRPGGFGWMITQRLASRVNVDVRPDGKTVDAALALP